MKRHVILMAALAVLATTALGAAALTSQTRTENDKGVSGTWDLLVKGPAAHGDMQATMALRQERSEVTGTLGVHGTEHSLKGTFTDGTLSLESTDAKAGQDLTFTAKLKDDGTLAGYLSGPMGDMQWTATRAAAPQH